MQATRCGPPGGGRQRAHARLERRHHLFAVRGDSERADDAADILPDARERIGLQCDDLGWLAMPRAHLGHESLELAAGHRLGLRKLRIVGRTWRMRR